MGRMKIDVDLNGLAEAERQIRKLPVTARFMVKDVVNEAALRIQTQAKKNLTRLKAVDTGRLRASIRPTFSADGLAAEIGTDVQYAAYIEFGTGPLAGNGRYFPPEEPLLAWMKRKGIPEEALWSIQWFIYQHGTQPRPYLVPAFEEVKPDYIAGLKRAFDQAGGK